MIIRKAEEKDLPALARLAGAMGYSSNMSLVSERYKQVVSLRDNIIFVAEDQENGVIGWVHVLPRILVLTEPMAEIGGLVVDELYRRRGIATELVMEAEKWVRSHGYDKIIVRSNVKRPESHDFYQSAGYECIKEQKIYVKTVCG